MIKRLVDYPFYTTLENTAKKMLHSAAVAVEVVQIWSEYNRYYTFTQVHSENKIKN